MWDSSDQYKICRFTNRRPQMSMHTIPNFKGYLEQISYN